MRILLVRHAESLANLEGRLQGRTDFSLSPTGRQQARLLSSRFVAELVRPTHVYASPLIRAVETAEIVFRERAVPIRRWSDLVEYDIGIFSGLTWQDIVVKYPETANAFEASRDWDLVEHVESVTQRQARALRVVQAILNNHDEDDVIVCFSHGGILQHIVSALLGADRTWGIPVHNTAVFEFSLDKRFWGADGKTRLNTRHCSIVRFNDVGHLKDHFPVSVQSKQADEA